MKYRVIHLDGSRVFAKWEAPGGLKSGAALDKLEAVIKAKRLGPGWSYELQEHDARKGWKRRAVVTND